LPTAEPPPNHEHGPEVPNERRRAGSQVRPEITPRSTTKRSWRNRTPSGHNQASTVRPDLGVANPVPIHTIGWRSRVTPRHRLGPRGVCRNKPASLSTACRPPDASTVHVRVAFFQIPSAPHQAPGARGRPRHRSRRPPSTGAPILQCLVRSFRIVGKGHHPRRPVGRPPRCGWQRRIRVRPRRHRSHLGRTPAAQARHSTAHGVSMPTQTTRQCSEDRQWPGGASWERGPR